MTTDCCLPLPLKEAILRLMVPPTGLEPAICSFAKRALDPFELRGYHHGREAILCGSGWLVVPVTQRVR